MEERDCRTLCNKKFDFVGTLKYNMSIVLGKFNFRNSYDAWKTIRGQVTINNALFYDNSDGAAELWQYNNALLV